MLLPHSYGTTAIDSYDNFDSHSIKILASSSGLILSQIKQEPLKMRFDIKAKFLARSTD